MRISKMYELCVEIAQCVSVIVYNHRLVDIHDSTTWLLALLNWQCGNNNKRAVNPLEWYTVNLSFHSTYHEILSTSYLNDKYLYAHVVAVCMYSHSFQWYFNLQVMPSGHVHRLLWSLPFLLKLNCAISVPFNDSYTLPCISGADVWDRRGIAIKRVST